MIKLGKTDNIRYIEFNITNILISVEEALTLIDKAILGTLKSEVLPIEKTLGRVLSKDIRAPISMPPFR